MPMKKIILILLILMLAGCKAAPEIRPDTIVDIPLEPTQTETVVEETTEATEATEPTEAPTEATEPATQEPTEAPTQKPSTSSSNKNISTKKPSSTSSSSRKDTSTKATQPPKPTQPTTEPATEPTTEPPTVPTTEPPTEAPTRPSVSSYSPTALDYAVADAINARRAEAGLPALTVSSSLSTAAAQRACELPINWSHTRPDGSWFTTVLDEFGCGSAGAAENLYYTAGSGDAETIVAKWMSSDAHRENILSEAAASIGVATCRADGVTYVAALFIG